MIKRKCSVLGGKMAGQPLRQPMRFRHVWVEIKARGGENQSDFDVRNTASKGSGLPAPFAPEARVVGVSFTHKIAGCTYVDR